MSAALIRLVATLGNMVIATKGSAPPNPPAKAEERKGYESDNATKDALSSIMWWYRPLGLVCSLICQLEITIIDLCLFENKDHDVHTASHRSLRYPSIILSASRLPRTRFYREIRFPLTVGVH